MASASRRMFSAFSTPPLMGTPKCASNSSGTLGAITATVLPISTPRSRQGGGQPHAAFMAFRPGPPQVAVDDGQAVRIDRRGAAQERQGRQRNVVRVILVQFDLEGIAGLGHPDGSCIAVAALDGHSWRRSILPTRPGMECSGEYLPRHFAPLPSVPLPPTHSECNRRMSSALILLTGHREAPYLIDYLRGYSTTLPIIHATDLEDLERECRPGRVLIAFCTAVIVPAALLDRLERPAFNFHPGPPTYPGRQPGKLRRL